MGANVMGYQGQLSYGVKGSTASTRVTGRKEVNYSVDPATGDTTEAGDGTAVPITTGEVTQLSPKGDFSLVFKNNSAALVAFLAASRTGNPIAIRIVPPGDGMTGLDADCLLSDEQGFPLDGEATIKFTIIGVSSDLRAPILNG